MQIIWNKEAAQSLRDRHTVLELETFVVGDQSVTAYCVVPVEHVFAEIAQLENIKALHESFIAAFNNKNYQLCQDLAPELIGSLGGELDTFYTTVLDKINSL